MSREGWVMLAFTLFVGALVLGFVGYDIYLHPADPEPVGKAIIEVTGAPDLRFSGNAGTLARSLGIEGQTPLTLRVPYRRADYIVANFQRAEAEDDPTETLTVRILDKGGEVVREADVRRPGGRTTLVWKVPPRQKERQRRRGA